MTRLFSYSGITHLLLHPIPDIISRSLIRNDLLLLSNLPGIISFPFPNAGEELSKSSIDKRIIPKFLVDKNENTKDLKILLNGLKLVGDYLEKTILKPNNLTQPISRLNFINTLK